MLSEKMYIISPKQLSLLLCGVSTKSHLYIPVFSIGGSGRYISYEYVTDTIEQVSTRRGTHEILDHQTD